MKRVLILHAYSAENLGDGLLVGETLALVRQAYGQDADITIAASDAHSFEDLGVSLVTSIPTFRGYEMSYLRTLWQIKHFDAVIAVGGGYLRAGSLAEGTKALLVHGPQLLAAARNGNRALYLPQSVGPLRFGSRRAVESLLGRMKVVMLRDDRSMRDVQRASPIRVADMATGNLRGPLDLGVPEDPVILSIRSVRGVVSGALYDLASKLGVYDSYVQSTKSGNDDRPATSTLSPRRLVTTQELLDGGASRPRVVVAVRLHAALMALRAGHYVIHLAYERKGFGAFQDLGLEEFVHNVFDFDSELVWRQSRALFEDPGVREIYRARLQASLERRTSHRDECISAMRTLSPS